MAAHSNMNYLIGQYSRKYILFILPFLIAPFYIWYQSYQSKADEIYIKELTKAIVMAQNSYHKEYNTYTSSLKDAGFSTSSQNLFIYTKTEDIPANELEKIATDNYPFFDKDSYQIVLKLDKKPNNPASFWLLTETGFVEQLYP